MNRITSPTDAGAREQRLSTQVDRQKWDAEWIAGQRLTTDVVRAGQGDGATEFPEATRATAPSAAPEKIAHASEPPKPKLEAAPNAAADRALAITRQSEPSRAASDTQTPLAFGGAYEPSRSAVSSSARAEPVATPGTQAPLIRSRFALWRTDDAVRVAMRLREPDSQTSRVISQLRTWLRDAGLTLSQVIVNGRSQESDRKQPPTLNTRI